MSKIEERIKHRKDLAQEAVSAALVDVQVEIEKREKLRREESENFFGHPGALIPKVHLHANEKREIMIKAVERVLNNWGVE